MAKQGKFQSARTPEPQLPQEAPQSLPVRIWEGVKTGATYLIMAAAVVMMVFTLISMNTFDQNDRDILGFQAFIVRSDSMSATDFSAGDLVVIQERDPSTLQPGDIISFRSADPNSLGETFTHKIRQRTTADDGQQAFITYGTTTGVDDVYPVPYSSVLGIYRFSIPKMGTFFAFMKTPVGYISCIFLPFLVILLLQGGGMVSQFRQLYREKEEAAEAEKQQALTAQQEALQSQQRQLRYLLAEVRSLKARIAQLEDSQSPKDPM